MKNWEGVIQEYLQGKDIVIEQLILEQTKYVAG